MPSNELEKKIADIQARATADKPAVDLDEPPVEGEPSLGEVIQFEFWGDGQRVAPNELLRCALFNVRNQNMAREYMKQKELAVLGGGEIRYTGEELRQDDHDVWLQILHLARKQPLGNAVEFERASFIREIGWTKAVRPSKRYYDKLFNSLNRLAATNLLIHSKRLRRGLGVSLIAKFEYEDEEGKNLRRWRIWLDKEIRDLFAPRFHTRLYWEQRHKLSALGKWLHGFFGSHRHPHPHKVATILEYCGSTSNNIGRFRASLKRALDELKDSGFLESWLIDENDCVRVRRADAKEPIDHRPQG